MLYKRDNNGTQNSLMLKADIITCNTKISMNGLGKCDTSENGKVDIQECILVNRYK